MEGISYPHFETKGSGYVYVVERGGRIIEARISRLEKVREGGLKGEVSIKVDKQPLVRTSPTLTSVSGVDSFWRKLNRRMHIDDYGIDWEAYVEELAGRVIDAHRSGTPVVRLRDVVVPESVEWEVNPYILRGQNCVVYGEGGSGKSMLALLMAVLVDTGFVSSDLGISAQHGKVLILDYETDEEEFFRRTNWLHNGLGIKSASVDSNIIYRRCSHPLAAEADRIKDIVEEEGVTCLIVDSLGLATGGGLDEAESVLAYFSALRWIETSTLTLTHTNKEGRIFGSVYTLNSGRSVWEVKSETPRSGVLDVVTFHRKSNIVGKERPRAYEMQFTDDAVTIKSKGVMQSEIAWTELSVSELVYQIIETEGTTAKLSLPDLVAEYKEKKVEKVTAAVATALSRHLKSGRLVEDTQGLMISLPNQTKEKEQEELWTEL